MLIGNNQFAGIEKGMDEQSLQRLISQMVEAFPDQTAKMSSEEKQRVVSTCSETAAKLGIEEENDVFRLLKINFLPDRILKSNYFTRNLFLILNNTNASGTARMDFIELQLIARFLKLIDKTPSN